MPVFQTFDIAEWSDVHLERVRLVARARLHLSHGIVIVSAPAGYGKTTLLRMLGQEIPDSALIPLSPPDRDVVSLEEHIQGFLDRHVLLLDDVHLLEGAKEAQDWLAKSIQERPRGWAISGRWIPAGLRSALHGLPVVHITEQDLAFTWTEVREWLGAIGYDDETLENWYHLTKGWPLAIAALMRLSDRYMAPASINVSLEEFLESVVFDRLWLELPLPVRHFLSLTGVALECSPDLAAFLWSRFAPEGSPPVEKVWQEIVNRRLFLEPGVRPDAWRYHTLFRRFLRSRAAHRQEVARAIVRWYTDQGWYEDAVEQALGDELWPEAVDLLLNHTYELIYLRNRIETFRRWVLSLPRPILNAHPLLLVKLGYWLGSFQRAEGETFLAEGVALAESSGDKKLLWKVYYYLADTISSTNGNTTRAMLYAHRLLEIAENREDRGDVWALIADIDLMRGNLVLAREHYLAAIPLLPSEEKPFKKLHVMESLAAGVLAPMGFIDRAEALLQRSAPLTKGFPCMRGNSFQARAAVYAGIGDWERMGENLTAMEEALGECEGEERQAEFWRRYLWTMYHLGIGHTAAASKHLEELRRGLKSKSAAHFMYVEHLRAWLARRQGRPGEAMRLAQEALERFQGSSLTRGLVALERDIAATETMSDPPPLHPEVDHLLRQRALPSLLRLRGLLAWRCYRAGRLDESRRHLRRIAAVLRRFPRLKPVLISRDPELARQVWRVALLLGEAEDLAIASLAAQGDPDAVTDLLSHPQPRVQCLAARVLAATGREEAMPLLHRALSRNLPPSVQACVHRALSELMTLPPPTLEVQFLGTFRVRRGGQEIPKEAWPRPAVARLFQYLVLHRGHPLPQDRVLEDLWPGQDPNQARNTLRRLLSWLRRVLEPYMPSKGPFRYLDTTWQTYTFDPDGRVTVDADAMVQVVEETMAAADEARIPPLPDALLQALNGWAPPVGAAPYDDWWLARVERWREAYAQGCAYVAHAYLVRQDYHTAAEWADRAIEEAPWMERAYQVKMKALARAGCRARALSVYEEASAALRRELDVEPSPRTKWLAKRLRRGEEI